MIELLLLFGISILGIVFTYLMARTILKKNVGPSPSATLTEQQLDVLADKVVSKLLSKLGKVSSTGVNLLAKKSPDVVQMDESIVPVKASIEELESNIDTIAEEKIVEDTKLSESKSKLSSILKRKKGK